MRSSIPPPCVEPGPARCRRSLDNFPVSAIMWSDDEFGKRTLTPGCRTLDVQDHPLSALAHHFLPYRPRTGPGRAPPPRPAGRTPFRCGPRPSRSCGTSWSPATTRPIPTWSCGNSTCGSASPCPRTGWIWPGTPWRIADFRTVKIDYDDEEPGEVVLRVAVEEEMATDFGPVIRYDRRDKYLLGGWVEQRNFRGRGERLRLEAVAIAIQRSRFSWGRPCFLASGAWRPNRVRPSKAISSTAPPGTGRCDRRRRSAVDFGFSFWAQELPSANSNRGKGSPGPRPTGGPIHPPTPSPLPPAPKATGA